MTDTTREALGNLRAQLMGIVSSFVGPVSVRTVAEVAADTIAALEAELGALRHDLKSALDKKYWWAEMEVDRLTFNIGDPSEPVRYVLESHLDAALAREKALREALTPFANIPYQELGKMDQRPSNILMGWNRRVITTGDVMRARAALAAREGEG